MSNKQLALLALSNFQRFVVGNMTMAFLPVFASRLGADSVANGLFLSLSFLTLTIGTLSGAWFSNRFGTRKHLIIIGSLLTVPLLLWMGYAENLTQLTISTMLCWFVSGVGISLTNILAGMYAGENERGRVFGVLGLAGGAAQIAAGMVSGTIMDAGGFSALLGTAAVLQLISTLTALLLEDRKTERQARPTAQAARPAPNHAVMGLTIASILANVVAFSNVLGRPLFMAQAGFDNTAISSTITAAGLISLPLPFLVGILSDRFNRRYLLMLCYGLVGIGAVVLANAGTIFEFQIAAALFAASAGAMTVGTALVIDLVNEQARARSISSYSATSWIGGVIGFSASGFMFEAFGLSAAFLLLSLVSGLSVFLAGGATSLGLRLLPARDVRPVIIDPRTTAEIPAGG